MLDFMPYIIVFLYTSLFTKAGSNTTNKLQTQHYERKKGKKNK